MFRRATSTAYLLSLLLSIAGARAFRRRAGPAPSPLRNSAGQTHYEVLGIPPSASKRTIRRVYKKMAKKLHPDKHKGASSDAFIAVNLAHEVLGHVRSRREYDARLARETRAHDRRKRAQRQWRQPRTWQQAHADEARKVRTQRRQQAQRRQRAAARAAAARVRRQQAQQAEQARLQRICAWVATSAAAVLGILVFADHCSFGCGCDAGGSGDGEGRERRRRRRGSTVAARRLGPFVVLRGATERALELLPGGGSTLHPHGLPASRDTASGPRRWTTARLSQLALRTGQWFYEVAAERTHPGCSVRIGFLDATAHDYAAAVGTDRTDTSLALGGAHDASWWGLHAECVADDAGQLRVELALCHAGIFVRLPPVPLHGARDVVIGCALNMDDERLAFFLNGRAIEGASQSLPVFGLSGDARPPWSGYLCPAVSLSAAPGAQLSTLAIMNTAVGGSGKDQWHHGPPACMPAARAIGRPGNVEDIRPSPVKGYPSPTLRLRHGCHAYELSTTCQTEGSTAPAPHLELTAPRIALYAAMWGYEVVLERQVSPAPVQGSSGSSLALTVGWADESIFAFNPSSSSSATALLSSSSSSRQRASSPTLTRGPHEWSLTLPCQALKAGDTIGCALEIVRGAAPEEEEEEDGNAVAVVCWFSLNGAWRRASSLVAPHTEEQPLEDALEEPSRRASCRCPDIDNVVMGEGLRHHVSAACFNSLRPIIRLPTARGFAARVVLGAAVGPFGRTRFLHRARRTPKARRSEIRPIGEAMLWLSAAEGQQIQSAFGPAVVLKKRETDKVIELGILGRDTVRDSEQRILARMFVPC